MLYCKAYVKPVRTERKVKLISLTLMPKEATVKYFDLISNNRPSPHWAKLALAGVMVAALAGCGGGSDGAAGAPGTPGQPGATGAPGKDLTAMVNVASLSADQWLA